MNLTCAKCGSSMEDGFLVDHTHGGVAKPEWADGPLQTSFWTGVKMKGKERRIVTTYRCTRCGYLESYAVESAE